MPKTVIEIIYQDNDIIIINKPTGVSVTADRSGVPELLPVLTEQLKSQQTVQLRLVHRLDKQTSGVMILAKNPQAQSQFSAYFEHKLIKKTYLALVTGAVTKLNGTINTLLIPHKKDYKRMCISKKKGKEAVTNWELLADFGIVKLLAVSPVTGRTHQIRVHLPSVGLPLTIDPLYGSKRALLLSDFKANYRITKGRIEKPLMKRLTLHAYQLELPETAQCQSDCFVASLDKKFAATIKMLTKHNTKGPDAFINPEDFSKIINGKKL